MTEVTFGLFSGIKAVFSFVVLIRHILDVCSCDVAIFLLGVITLSDSQTVLCLITTCFLSHNGCLFFKSGILMRRLKAATGEDFFFLPSFLNNVTAIATTAAQQNSFISLVLLIQLALLNDKAVCCSAPTWLKKSKKKTWSMFTRRRCTNCERFCCSTRPNSFYAFSPYYTNLMKVIIPFYTEIAVTDLSRCVASKTGK